ncbi:MAG: kynureninase [Candidatus Dormibacteria bacterium]
MTLRNRAVTAPTTRAACVELDVLSPLRALRDRFVLEDGLVYLDGNSLGALPRQTAARMADVVERQWGRGLIRSWNSEGWIDAPRRVGDKIGKIIGAAPGETIVADSTSVNLFKLAAGALSLRPERRTILVEAGNFPSDRYIADGVASLLGSGYRVLAVAADQLEPALSPEVALLLLPHVHYATGRVHPMRRLTGAAHDAGTLVLWDLSHSAGALPLALDADGVDLAVGCGYKYLNGGPGAPAYLYVTERLAELLPSVLPGWMGHAAPFSFEEGHRPAPGVARQLCGTPPILSLVGLESGVDLWLEVDMAEVRRRSEQLSQLFLDLVSARCQGLGLIPICPAAAAERGSQVAFRHPDGYALMQALIERRVVGDFRSPDVVRFGITPLYLRAVDVWDAVEAIRAVLVSGAHTDARHGSRAAVT